MKCTKSGSYCSFIYDIRIDTVYTRYNIRIDMVYTRYNIRINMVYTINMVYIRYIVRLLVDMIYTIFNSISCVYYNNIAIM